MYRTSPTQNRAIADAMQNAGVSKKPRLSPHNQVRTERLKRAFSIKSETAAPPESSVAVLEEPQSPTEIQAPPEPVQTEIDAVLDGIQELVESPQQSSQELPQELPHTLPESAQQQVIESHTDSPQTQAASDPIEEITWRNPTGPFSGNLTLMANQTLDAKSRIGFTLEQAKQRKENREITLRRAQEEFDTEVNLINRLNARLVDLDLTLQAITDLASQSSEVADLLTNKKHPVAPITEKRQITRSGPNDPTVLRTSDLREFFLEHPDTVWTKKAVLDELPACKREHAAKRFPSALNELCLAGVVERLERGQYKLVKRSEPDTMPRKAVASAVPAVQVVKVA